MNERQISPYMQEVIDTEREWRQHCRDLDAEHRADIRADESEPHDDERNDD